MKSKFSTETKWIEWVEVEAWVGGRKRRNERTKWEWARYDFSALIESKRNRNSKQPNWIHAQGLQIAIATRNEISIEFLSTAMCKKAKDRREGNGRRSGKKMWIGNIASPPKRREKKNTQMGIKSSSSFGAFPPLLPFQAHQKLPPSREIEKFALADPPNPRRELASSPYYFGKFAIFTWN